MEEYERERARDAYRSEKEAKSAASKRKLQYVYDVIIAFVIIYLVIFIKDLFGFGDIVIFDASFFRVLFIIAGIVGLGFFIFPKGK